MLRIILNEQTPCTNPTENTKEWIEKNQTILRTFLAYCFHLKNAVGLASNQIAFRGNRIMDRFFATKSSGHWKIIINPELKSIKGDSIRCEEGCLTWPNRTIIAERYPSILVSYWNQDGSFIENEFLDDYEAQVWQHEINHLDGKQEILKDLPIKKEERLPGRNEPCFCGSGKKFKKCCGK